MKTLQIIYSNFVPGKNGFHGWSMGSDQLLTPDKESSVTENGSNSLEPAKYWRLQNWLKDDPAERESHWNVAHHYTQITASKFQVKKEMAAIWTKPSLGTLSQYALFKCMHSQCIFATDADEDMSIHMESHLTLIDVLKSRNGDSMTKTMRDQQIQFRDCCYCNFEACTNNELINHIADEHGQSVFQCSHCFYRSIEVDHIMFHYESCHPNEKREVLLCGETCEFRQQDHEMLINDCEMNIEKIKCGQGKRFKRFFGMAICGFH